MVKCLSRSSLKKWAELILTIFCTEIDETLDMVTGYRGGGSNRMRAQKQVCNKMLVLLVSRFGNGNSNNPSNDKRSKYTRVLITNTRLIKYLHALFQF